MLAFTKVFNFPLNFPIFLSPLISAGNASYCCPLHLKLFLHNSSLVLTDGPSLLLLLRACHVSQLSLSLGSLLYRYSGAFVVSVLCTWRYCDSTVLVVLNASHTPSKFAELELKNLVLNYPGSFILAHLESICQKFLTSGQTVQS